MTEPKLRWQQATIVAITPLSHRIKSFVFAPSEPFVFRAGQHVDVRLTAPDGYQAERSYSIASAPGWSGNRFELAIERLDDGEVSPFFHDVAAVGDSIELRGPIGGHFVWSEEDGPILLLGGGSGIVPLLSMLRLRVARSADTPMALIYSARTWDELIYRDELLGIRSRNSGLALAFALTREPARDRDGYSRRIDAAMVSDVLPALLEAPRRTFVCGSNRFVEAATAAALAAHVPTATIRTERYGG